MIFFHESPTLLPNLNHKLYHHENVVLYITLYFISITFMTLKLGRDSIPVPQPPPPFPKNLWALLTPQFFPLKI